MPSEGQLLSAIESLNTRIDNGFNRVHNRMDEIVRDHAKVSTTVAQIKAKVDNFHEQPCPTMQNHLDEHPSKAKMNQIILDAEEDKQDKRRVVVSIIDWSIRGIILFFLAKFGLDKWFN